MKKLLAIFLITAAPIVVAAQASGAKPQAAPAEKAPAPADTTAKPAAKPSDSVDPAKAAAIKKLFEVQGTRKAMETTVVSMSENMKPMLANSLPPGEYREQLIDLFFKKFQSKLKIDDMLDMLIPIYDKHFSTEDLEGLTKFYQTPLGQRAISVLPQVITESQSISMKWGQELGRASMMEVLDEHPDLKKSLEDAAAGPKQ